MLLLDSILFLDHTLGVSPPLITSILVDLAATLIPYIATHNTYHLRQVLCGSRVRV